MSRADVFLGATAALEQSLFTAQLDDSIERISVSSAGRAKTYASSERRADVVHAVPSTLSPSSTAGIAAFGPGHNASAHSSPTTTRYQDILGSSTWRQPVGFVRQSAGASDDPFVSEQAATQSSDQGKHRSPSATQ